MDYVPRMDWQKTSQSLETSSLQTAPDKSPIGVTRPTNRQWSTEHSPQILHKCPTVILSEDTPRLLRLTLALQVAATHPTAECWPCPSSSFQNHTTPTAAPINIIIILTAHLIQSTAHNLDSSPPSPCLLDHGVHAIYLVTACMPRARWPTLCEVTPAMEMRPSLVR